MGLDEFFEPIFRRLIYNFNVTEELVPLVEYLRIKLSSCEEQHETPMKEKVGFRWKEMKSKRVLLIERIIFMKS